MLEVDRLEIAHGDAVAVWDVSLTVRPRELVTVVGPNGAGQQQMVAIGRALMAMPRLLLLDEPSLGLAPQIVDQVFEVVAGIHAEGVAVLLVEQNIVQAFAIAARAYVLERGRIVAEGAPSEVAQDPRIREAYLGQSG